MPAFSIPPALEESIKSAFPPFQYRDLIPQIIEASHNDDLRSQLKASLQLFKEETFIETVKGHAYHAAHTVSSVK